MTFSLIDPNKSQGENLLFQQWDRNISLNSSAHAAVLWGTCLSSIGFVCGVNYGDTSSEELGGILERKGTEVGKVNGKETPGGLKALKPHREFTWPKSYLALIDTTAKSPSAFHPALVRRGWVFFCHALDFQPQFKTTKKPCDFLKLIYLYKLESFNQEMCFAPP